MRTGVLLMLLAVLLTIGVSICAQDRFVQPSALCLAVSSDEPNVTNLLRIAANRMGKTEEARRYFNKALERDSHNVDGQTLPMTPVRARQEVGRTRLMRAYERYREL